MVLKLVYFGKQAINTPKTLKCGVGDGKNRLSRSRQIFSVRYIHGAKEHLTDNST